MVGIPGRSKGCVTCRKRKKGCDSKRPACSQCLERHILCGGYDLDRVFITSKYMQTPSSACTLPNHRGDSMTGLVAASTYQVTPHSLAQSAFIVKCMEAAFKLFPAYKDASGALHMDNKFPTLLAKLSMQEEALRQTISAVGLVTLGKGSNDQAMLRKGRVLYGNALQELGLALLNPRRRTSEALLATTRLMGLYEIMYGAGGEELTQARNWMTHAQGELALILSRGPEAFTTGAAHFMFSLARYNSAITSIRSQKPCVFNEEQWKTVPWQGRVKSPSDEIIDIILEIPGIISELGYLDTLSPNDGCFDGLRLKTAAKSWMVHCKLVAWLKDNSNKVYTTDVEDPTPIEFADLGTALLSLRYWATATLLYQSLDRALRYSSHDTLPPYVDRPHGRYFARLIARSVSWLFRKNNGITGASALSFPLGIALMFLRQSNIPDPEYLDLVYSVWNDPEWPSSIKDFLRSMGRSIQLPTGNLPENPVTWSTCEIEPILDAHGKVISGPFNNDAGLHTVV